MLKNLQSQVLYSHESDHKPCKTQQGGDTRSTNGDKPSFSSDLGWPKVSLCGLKEPTGKAGGKKEAGIAKINEPTTSSLELLELLSLQQEMQN